MKPKPKAKKTLLQNLADAFRNDGLPKQAKSLQRHIQQSIPWHSLNPYPHLLLHDLAVRELYLLAIIINRDWTQNDTNNKQDKELVLISKQLKRVAKRLHKVFNETDSFRSTKNGVPNQRNKR
jgi:hypothetical protein